MKVEFAVSGLDELIEMLEEHSNPAKREKAEKKALERIGKRAKTVMESHIPVSKDNSKSGRSLKFGGESRPTHGHAKDNIPVTTPRRGKDGTMYMDVGWLLSDNSEYFYMKFVEWGTSKMNPRDFLENTTKECEDDFVKITIEEYEKLLADMGVL